MVMKISYAYYKEDFIVNGNLHVSKKSAVSDPKFQSTEFQLTEPSMKNKKIRIKAKNYIGPNKLDAETIRRGASCSQEDEGESEREVIFPATKQLIGNLFGRFTSRENHAHSQKLAKAIHHEHTKFQERIRSKKTSLDFGHLDCNYVSSCGESGEEAIVEFQKWLNNGHDRNDTDSINYLNAVLKISAFGKNQNSIQNMSLSDYAASLHQGLHNAHFIETFSQQLKTLLAKPQSIHEIYARLRTTIQKHAAAVSLQNYTVQLEYETVEVAVE